MKNAALLVLLLAAAPAFSLDWKLPVVTAAWETAGGQAEDEEEATLVAASLRNTVTLRLREDASPAAFALALRYSAKDYLLESGDYQYLEASEETSLRVSPLLKLGASLGGRYEEFGQLDSGGLSKDFLALKGRLEATMTPLRGTSLEAGVGARLDLAEEPSKTMQAWTVSGGISSRLGQWVLAARYRGEFRLGLGDASAVETAAYHVGSISAQWDPNRQGREGEGFDKQGRTE
jgi:hypothetical protein